MTEKQLKNIVPNISDYNLKIYMPLINSIISEYEFNTNERLACFIAQAAHESDSFKVTQEYASGKMYEGRKDLGNIYPGDGIKFKGRGLIQCTGRNNYQLCSQFLFKDNRLIDNPEILEQPQFALASACWYWHKNKLNNICDKLDNWTHDWQNRIYNKFEWLTVKINGGLNGYADRLVFYERARKELA